MPRIYECKDGRCEIIREINLPPKIARALSEIGKILNRAKRTRNPSSGNSQVAQGKPARHRAKRDAPAKGRPKAKVSRTKRGRSSVVGLSKIKP